MTGAEIRFLCSNSKATSVSSVSALIGLETSLLIKEVTIFPGSAVNKVVISKEPK